VRELALGLPAYAADVVRQPLPPLC
jgi:hypothetical protein